MRENDLSSVISSPTRLMIASLLSSRPRSLRELSYLTGVSIQGVLKHLDKLGRLGLVEVNKVDAPGIRKVYSLRGFSVGDFSIGDLTIVKKSKQTREIPESARPTSELEYLAEDTMILRRRIRDQARKLGRLIDEMVGNEERLKMIISSMRVSDEERMILQTAFTEETLDDAGKAISRNLGIKEGRRSIDKALAKAKRIDKK